MREGMGALWCRLQGSDDRNFTPLPELKLITKPANGRPSGENFLARIVEWQKIFAVAGSVHASGFIADAFSRLRELRTVIRRRNFLARNVNGEDLRSLASSTLLDSFSYVLEQTWRSGDLPPRNRFGRAL